MIYLKQLKLKLVTTCLIACGLVLFMTSCQKDSTIDETIEANETQTLEFAKTVEAMAAAVSGLITSDQAWEEAIKQRALVSENGDQVFLYAFAKDMTVNGVSFSDALAQHSDKSRSFFSTEIVDAFPVMSIAYNVPVGKLREAINIDVSKVYYDFLDDDKYAGLEEIPHFENAEKTVVAYDEINKATQAYFIVRNNERIILFDQVSGEILNDPDYEKDYLSFEPNKAFFFSPAALVGTLGNVEYRLNAPIGHVLDESPEDTRSGGCFRDTWTHVRDGSTAIVYTHDREGIFNGGPEIRQRMNRVLSNASLQPFNAGMNYSNGNTGNQLTFNFNAFLLNGNIHGDSYGWAWWEEDGGSGDDRFNGSFGANIPYIGELTLNYDFAKNKDDNYGNMEVSWCMGAQWIYMGDIRWWGGPTHW